MNFGVWLRVRVMLLLLERALFNHQRRYHKVGWCRSRSTINIAFDKEGMQPLLAIIHCRMNCCGCHSTMNEAALNLLIQVRIWQAGQCKLCQAQISDKSIRTCTCALTMTNNASARVHI